jgi:hypothetical protein
MSGEWCGMSGKEAFKRGKRKTAMVCTVAVFLKALIGNCLLDLGFFVLDVFASFGVELHDQHLFRHCLFVLGGGVEVTGVSSGDQFDFFASAFGSHEYFSLILARN